MPTKDAKPQSPGLMGPGGIPKIAGEHQQVNIESLLSTYVAQMTGMPGANQTPPGLHHGGVPYAMLSYQLAQQQHQQEQARARGQSSVLEQPDDVRSSRSHRLSGGDTRSDESEAQRRAVQLQEKNRRAQRRFRERQKARVSELLEQVEALTNKVEGLEAENVALTNQGNILQKLLAMKEEYIGQMSQQVKARKAQEGSTSGEEEFVIEDSDNNEIKIVRSEMLEQLGSAWRGYVNKLAGCLVEGGSDHPNSEVIDRISKLVADSCTLCKKAAIYDSVITKKWFLSSMEESVCDKSADEESKNSSRGVIRSLALSAQQRQEMHELRKIHLQKIENLNNEVAKNVLVLDESLAGDGPSDLPPGPSGRALARQFIEQSKSAATLKNNIREQSNAAAELDATLFERILTPLQMARVMVQSYPLVPDALMLLNHVFHEKKRV